MKKSLVLGIAVAASFAFAEAAWVKSGSALVGESAKSISTLGSLLNERSFSTWSSTKLVAAVSDKEVSLAGLAADRKSIGTHWKDVSGGVSGQGNVAVGIWEEITVKSDGGLPGAPEASTWAGVVAIGLAMSLAWRRSQMQSQLR